MYFAPVNRYIRISFEEKEKEESLLIMPEDYKKQEEPYQEAVVISSSYDIRFSAQKGDRILIDRKMVQEIKTEDFGTIYLILDNYVLGVISRGK